MADFSALIAQIEAYVKQNGNNEITGNGLQSILVGMVNALGTVAITALQGDLADEVTARQNADGTLQQGINTERQQRQDADGAINAKIPAEASSSNKLADKAFVTGLTTALQNAVNAIKADIENGYVYAGIATPSGTPVSGRVCYLARQAGTYTNFGGLTLTEGVNVLKYNGTAWSQEQLISIAEIYKNPLMGYYECDTAGATAAKTVAATGYVLPTTGGSVKIKMAYRNTVANATLNINSTGAKPLFYNGVRAGVGNTWDTNEVIEVYYDGTNYQAYNVAGSNGDGVFDISAYNLTDGQPTPYVDLAAALGTDGANVPQSLRKGGISVKFIQGSVPSTDNKYRHYTYLLQYENTTAGNNAFKNTANWRGVVDKPVFRSKDVIESGGVNPLQLEVFGETSEQESYEWASGSMGWKPLTTIIPKGATVYCDSANYDRTVIFGASNGQGGVGTTYNIEHFTQGTSFVAEKDLEYIFCSYVLELTIHYKYKTIEEKVDEEINSFNLSKTEQATQINIALNKGENTQSAIILPVASNDKAGLLLAKNQWDSTPTKNSAKPISSGAVYGTTKPLQLEVFGETSELQTFEWSGASWKAINPIIPKGATVYCDSASADRTVVFATSNGQGGIGTSYSIEHFTQGKSFIAEDDLEYVNCSYALTLTIHYKYITLGEKITDIQGDINDIKGDVSELGTEVNGHSSEIKGIESVIDGISLTRELTLAQSGNINIPYSLKSGKKYVILVEGEIMVNVRYRVTEASAIVPIVNVLSGTYEYTAEEDAGYINIYTNAAGQITIQVKEKGYHCINANEDIPELLIEDTENDAITPQATKNAYIKYTDHTLTNNASMRTTIFKVVTGKKYDILVPGSSGTVQSIAFANSANATTFDNNGCVGEYSAHQYYGVIALDEYLFVSYMGNATDSPSVKLSSEKVAKYVGADEQLDERITVLEQNQPTAIRHIYLPPYIHIVAGDPFELFWKSMIIAADYDSVNVKVDCPVGANYKRKFFYQNPVVGTYTMKVGVYDNNDVKMDEQTTTLIVTAAASTSPTNNVNILCVGASDLVNGIWAGESHRRLVGGNGWTTGSGATGLRYPAGIGLNNITFIGGMINTITDGDNVEYTAGFEANGGWSFHEYNIAATNANSKKLVVVDGTKTQLDIHSLYTDSHNNIWRLETIFDATHYKVDLVTSVGGGTFPESGTLTYLSGGTDTSNIVYSGTQPVNANPFWDDTNSKISFKNYMSSLGKANENIDYIYVELGESKLIGNNPDWGALKQSIITFIDNVRNTTDGYPNCKIVLVRYIIPCYDGVAANYGCDYKWYDMMQRCLKLSAVFDEVVALYQNVFIVDAGIQVDLENAMQRLSRAKNQRSLENEYIQFNAMHPATMGYLQIADAVFRDMNYRLQQ